MHLGTGPEAVKTSIDRMARGRGCDGVEWNGAMPERPA